MAHSPSRRSGLTRHHRWAVWGFAFLLPAVLSGCPQDVLPGPDGGISNTTDPTNGGAAYLGSATCAACHPSVGAFHGRHGHSQILKTVQGTPPEYPAGPDRAGVADPPPGLTWDDIAYVIGGYTKAARFVDREGFLLTDAGSGDFVEYELALPHLGSTAGYAAFGSPGRTPYEEACFRCHTTGPVSFSASGMREGNRPGIDGHWAEAGVGCEACHGPGSRHVPNPSLSNIYIDPNSSTCMACHSSPEPGILARNGFILGYQQAEEVAASPHARFTCSVCHDPHASVFADRETAIRNNCQTCHGDMNMALHEGLVFTRGEYSEALRCESCHMSFAAAYAQTAPPEFAPGGGRIGDTRTHLMLINSAAVDFTSMFTADGVTLALDGDGRGAVTVDFACMRCHNGQGNAFALSLSRAAEIAGEVHGGSER